MHRLVMNAKDEDIIDHINGNKLDNRKSNLRLCTKQENCRHRVKLSSNNTSGYNGIYFDKRRNKYVPQITINNKVTHIGMYAKVEDAIEARKNAEEEHFGEFKSTIRDGII